MQFGFDRCTVSFTTVPSAGIAYPAGWNLVGLLASVAPVGDYYTLQTGDSSYGMVAGNQVQPGQGYWAYFAQPTAVSYEGESVSPNSEQIRVPAGKFVMIGDPFPTPCDVGPADVATAIYTYGAGGYTRAEHLDPGQGAFVYSSTGGTLTLAPRMPQSPGS
ncbi:MAG TPA: hypothetical protein VFA70_15630 [Dehalococcoidia bacterium]|nr:hypothetical protein [Dehalococcoidia bacterium]